MRPPVELPVARIDGAGQTGCWHGSDDRSLHDIGASPPWWKHPLARPMTLDHDGYGMPSNGKNTTVRGVRWAPVMPTARPHNVGPCASRASCQKIDPAIELHAGGEVCPASPSSDSYGRRTMRALAARPLQPSRAWSRRLDRRHRAPAAAGRASPVAHGASHESRASAFVVM